jgi:hypothetical protein
MRFYAPVLLLAIFIWVNADPNVAQIARDDVRFVKRTILTTFCPAYHETSVCHYMALALED